MLERQELALLKEKGYKWNDLFDIVKIFEKKLSEYTGAAHVTVTDSCTHSLELCLRYMMHKNKNKDMQISIPAYTYISIPMLLEKLKLPYSFHHEQWKGFYYLQPTSVVDMAQRFTKDCFIEKTYCCLSFGTKKILNINRGGAILTDDLNAHNYFQLARSDGRDYSHVPWSTQEKFEVLGYHYNLSIEDCGRGILLMDELLSKSLHYPDSMKDCFTNYPDLSKKKLKF